MKKDKINLSLLGSMLGCLGPRSLSLRGNTQTKGLVLPPPSVDVLMLSINYNYSFFNSKSIVLKIEINTRYLTLLMSVDLLYITKCTASLLLLCAAWLLAALRSVEVLFRLTVAKRMGGKSM